MTPTIARIRPYALFSALVFLCCELISRPFTPMAVCDDWSYLLSARILAQTGHIVYNGWATAMLGWQLYAGALFLKLFGGSDTAARMSTLAMAVVTTFLIHRIMVRHGITEANATIGTLSFVLTPIYMQISATFMSDLPGLFAIVLCLYASIRGLQARTPRAALVWIVFAVVSNVIFGTARQTGWLGALVIVPCTLYLLRKTRSIVIPGAVITVAGWVAIYGAMHWFARQPYALPEPLSFHAGGLRGLIYVARQMLKAVLESFFLVLPLVLLFFVFVRRGGKLLTTILIVTAIGYTAMAIVLTRHNSPSAMLEPLLGDWFSAEGFYLNGLHGAQPIILGTAARILLTVLATLATICFAAFVLSLRDARARTRDNSSHGGLSWRQFRVLLLPLVLTYCALLLPRATANLRDRYLLVPALVAAVVMLRLYQAYVHPRLPAWSIAAVAIIALFSIAATHDLFALSRARVALAEEFQAAGIARTEVDGGFEFNGPTELEVAGHINDPRIVNPPNLFIPVDPHRGPTCTSKDETDAGTVHVVPKYGIAFNRDACAGPTNLPPVAYRRWLTFHTGQIYLVRFPAAGGPGSK
jgi:hypothetical protein